MDGMCPISMWPDNAVTSTVETGDQDQWPRIMLLNSASASAFHAAAYIPFNK